MKIAVALLSKMTTQRFIGGECLSLFQNSIEIRLLNAACLANVENHNDVGVRSVAIAAHGDLLLRVRLNRVRNELSQSIVLYGAAADKDLSLIVHVDDDFAQGRADWSRRAGRRQSDLHLALGLVKGGR